jgi:hypothetical protein
MADNGRWFKLWVTSITDNTLASLPNELWAVWGKLGAYIKCHGQDGEISLKSPEKMLCSIMQCDDFNMLINAIKCFPNVSVTSVTNATVTYKVKYENWLKYQGDFSGDRVKKYRAKKRKSVTPKKRREEKREEEKRKEEEIPTFINASCWKEFLLMRKKIKKEPTDNAKELLIKDLIQLKDSGQDPNECLKQSIKNNWQSIYPLKNQIKQERLSDAYKSL